VLFLCSRTKGDADLSGLYPRTARRVAELLRAPTADWTTAGPALGADESSITRPLAPPAVLLGFRSRESGRRAIPSLLDHPFLS